MFCSCLNDPDEKRPNTNICPVCLGHPGTLPVINEEAIKKVIKTGLALNCEVPDFSKFDRKNYFYPDLPKGYQISQYDAPLCKEGYLEIPIVSENNEADKFQMTNDKIQINSKIQNSKIKKIRIRRVHLEEDTGRLVHPAGANFSLVDFNRAGIPLMELVTEPDIRSGGEARQFAEELQLILRYLDISQADMEKGQLRVEVNISLTSADPGDNPDMQKLGTKVEIKNLNSFRSVERGINYEIERQQDILDSGRKVIQETRGWNEVRGITVGQREKEAAHDYRYFPEPDLPPLHLTKEEVEKIRPEIPELPQAKRQRLLSEYQLEEKAVEIFVRNKELGEYFEKVVSEFDPRLKQEKLFELIKLAVNYLTTDLLGLLKEKSVADRDFLITPENFAEFITLIHQGRISSPIAKTVLPKMFMTGADPSHIIEESGLSLVTDEKEIDEAVKPVIAKNAPAVADYQKGKVNALQFLVGQIMAETKGKVSPPIVRDILIKTLTKTK